MEFAKKTIVGGYRAVEESGLKDATHIILNISEYDDLTEKYRKAQSMLQQIRERADADIERVRKECRQDYDREMYLQKKMTSDQVEQANVELTYMRKQLDGKEREIKQLQKDIKSADELNRDLLRICKERANATRGICPKKKHDGYIILDSRQWHQRYNEELPQNGYEKRTHEWLVAHDKIVTQNKGTSTWKSRIQTPYDIGMRLENIQSKIEQDLKSSVLEEIGVEQFNCRNENGRFCRVWDDDGNEKNLLYKWDYKANVCAGMWEVEVYTTLSLAVPEYRRPRFLYKSCSERVSKRL